jgi:hypothetical protein
MTTPDAGLIDGRDRVVKIIEELHQELEAGAEWENDTLGRYLDGLAALLSSIEKAYSNVGRPTPKDAWILIGDALRGATNYE